MMTLDCMGVANYINVKCPRSWEKKNCPYLPLIMTHKCEICSG